MNNTKLMLSFIFVMIMSTSSVAFASSYYSSWNDPEDMGKEIFGSYEIVNPETRQVVGLMRVSYLGRDYYGSLYGLQLVAEEEIGYLSDYIYGPMGCVYRWRDYKTTDEEYFNTKAVNLVCPRQYEDGDWVSLVAVNDQKVALYLSDDRAGRPSYILKRLAYDLGLDGNWLRSTR